MWRVIKKMYEGSKSMVLLDGEISEKSEGFRGVASSRLQSRIEGKYESE